MAYVIAVCGAGGKTTKVFELAKEYASKKLSVAITTTTFMWAEDKAINFDDIKEIPKKSTIDFIVKKIDKKVTTLTEEEYNKICSLYDVVIVEADGSRSMPLKIPRIDSEPVIPKNVSEIIIVFGLQSIGRKIKDVCHRYNELSNKLDELDSVDGNTIVTEQIIKDFYTNFYEKPLKQKYNNAKISLYLVDITKSNNFQKYKKIAFVLCASGHSNRFGENKLLYQINNKPMYEWTLSSISEAKNDLIDIFKNRFNHELTIDLFIISCYDAILNDNKYNTINLKNDLNNTGLSSCLKISIDNMKDYDAICYYNADLPMIDKNEIVKMIYYYIFSNDSIGAMFVQKEMHNPAIFDKQWFDEINKIDGDRGPKKIILDNLKKCFKYHTYEEHLTDIDTINDLNKIFK